MRRLVEIAADLQHFFESRNWGFCFIDGLAVQHWGEPRLTRDLDVSLLTGFGNEERFIDPLLVVYPERMPHAREFALQRRVLLLASADGVGIDIILAALPFEEEAIQRACSIEMLPSARLKLCSAEDLVVYKIFAGRPLDIEDARSVLVRQSKARLDLAYVEARLRELSEITETNLGEIWNKLVSSVG